MRWFVQEGSVVRRIWGKADTILLIVAGSAAEFALNKAVDWLFFTGRLPADPLGRLFSTVAYARKIVFSKEDDANAVIDRMAFIHHEVESQRNARIPQWAYRDVLYMLIDYSIRSYELLEHSLTDFEKEEVYDVFKRVGVRMGIQDLPQEYASWVLDRERHMNHDLTYSQYSEKLFQEYRKHLGSMRYSILLSAQSLLVPEKVRVTMKLRSGALMKTLLPLYKVSRAISADWFFKKLILPPKYLQQVMDLDSQK